MRPRPPLSRLLAGLAVLLPASLSACRLDPAVTRPDTDTRPSWRDRTAEVASLANSSWFDIYRDDALQRLIRAAIENNPDLGIALARIDEARALAKVAGADLYPRVDFSAAAGGIHESRVAVPFGDRDHAVSKASFDLSWEIDLFGRIRTQAEAATAEYFASVEAHRDVTIRLIADVARAYFELRELDELLLITERTLKSRQEYTDLAKVRFEGGKTSEIDFRQAESEYWRTLTVHIDVQRQITNRENVLSVLTGHAPGVVPRGRAARDQQVPPTVPAGLPSDLIARRPDIVAADDTLVAQTALVGTARANLYPRIALTGSAGWESEELKDLFNSSSATYSLIGGLLQPIFNAGKNKALVEAQCARMRAAMEAYRKTVLAAFAEVEDGLVDFRRFGEQRVAQESRVEALRKVLWLAEERYKGGVAQYLEVLDAQRALFDAEIEQEDTIRLHLVALTQLYKALGGGWDASCQVPGPAVVPHPPTGPVATGAPPAGATYAPAAAPPHTTYYGGPNATPGAPPLPPGSTPAAPGSSGATPAAGGGATPGSSGAAPSASGGDAIPTPPPPPAPPAPPVPAPPPPDPAAGPTPKSP